MTDVIFSAQYNTTSNQKLRFAIRAIEQSNVRLSVLVQAPELSIKAIQKTLFPEAIRAGGRFVKFIQKLLGIRLQATKVEHKDIFFYIQKAKVADTGKGLDLVELSTETTTMIVAGSDTTFTAMAATLHYLSYSPTDYAMLTDEVRSKFKVLDEFRMGSIAQHLGGPLLREVDAGGAVIDGSYVPAGYGVAMGIYSIHHNAAYYSEPLTFDPNRWVRPTDKLQATEMHKDYIPFGMGARSCIGKPLALHAGNGNTVLSVHFRASNRDEEAWDNEAMIAEPFLMRDHSTGQKVGPFMKFRLRKMNV